MAILTPVGVCNSALIQLGDIPITSFDDGTQRSDTCRDEYPKARDTVLEVHPWNFACSYGTLQRIADAPAWGWAYQYVLPTEPYCLRVLQMQHNMPFEVGVDPLEGRVLFTNEATANIRYIWRQTDLERWTGLAVEALTIFMAKVLAPFVTGKQTTRDAMIMELKQWLAAAGDRDAHEGTPHAVPPNRFLAQVRHRTGGGSRFDMERIGTGL
mgnify:FL=1